MAINPEEKDKTKHIGIEFEFASDASEDVIRYFLSKTSLRYHLGDDGSIDTYMSGKQYEYTHELRVLTTRRSLEKDLKIVASLFKEFKCEVNDSCGLHVHLDCRNFSYEQVYKNLLAKQRDIYSLCNTDRIGSEYCVPLDYENAETSLNDVKNDGDGGDHYDGINIAAFSEHKTIEVRCHEGSKDFDDIYKYIRYLYSVAYGFPMAVDLKRWKKRYEKTEHLYTRVPIVKLG